MKSRQRDEESAIEHRHLQLESDALNILPRGLAVAHPVFVTHASGTELWDTDGRRFLDFIAGIGTLNVGHGHPRVIKAAMAQLERFTHTAFQAAMYESYIRLAQALRERVPISGEKKVAFFTTGAEAVENAVKIARAATGRPGIVSFTSGFHGRTYLGMGLTGKTNPYKQNFGPFVPETYLSIFPDTDAGVSSADALAHLESLFVSTIIPERVAAIIIEPVAGEGGFLPAPPEFMVGLRNICDRHGICLVADEIQTGFGRTGKMFAVEHSGIEPDLLLVAKSIAGGFPLSGVIGRAELMDGPGAGGLGGTYGGNPVACAAGLAVLEVIDDENLIERSNLIGERIRAAADDFRDRFREISFVRGLGAMMAIQFNDPDGTPRPDIVRSLLTAARDRGLLLFHAGMNGNVIRFLPPLTTTDEQVDEAMGILADCLSDYCSQALAV